MNKTQPEAIQMFNEVMEAIQCAPDSQIIYNLERIAQKYGIEHTEVAPGVFQSVEDDVRQIIATVPFYSETYEYVVQGNPDITKPDVQVAPGVFQSAEDYEANMAFEEARDNELQDEFTKE